MTVNPAADADVFDFDPDRDKLFTPDGQRITTVLIEAVAQRAEHDGPPPGLIPGGKSLSGGATHSPVIRTVVSEQTSAKVKAAAAGQGKSVSRYLRDLLERELAA